MQANWNIKSRAHECSRTGRPFEEGEKFYTAIYFDTDAGEFLRRDVAEAAWEEETAERKPFSYWKSEYVKPDSAKPKLEMSSRESAEDLLRRFVEEDEPHTEHARYILALMLERKKQLVPKEVKENELGKTIIYEHRKSGEVFIIRDPELRLDELAMVQDEVAMLLGFGGPAAEAAAAVGMRITPDGKIEKLEKEKAGKSGKADKADPTTAAADESAPEASPDAPAETEPVTESEPVADETVDSDVPTDVEASSDGEPEEERVEEASEPEIDPEPAVATEAAADAEIESEEPESKEGERE